MRHIIAAFAVCAAVGAAQAQEAPPKIRVEVQELKRDGLAPGVDRVKPAPLSAFWVGVGVEPVSELLATHLGLDYGLVADLVSDNSPASKAGVEVYDVLLKFNGAELRSVADLIQAVEKAKDQEVEVELIRQGERMTLKITPERRPEGEAMPLPPQIMAHQNELQELVNKAMKEQGLGRLMVVRPPFFEEGAKMPKSLKFSTRIENGKERVEVELDGEKFEANSIDELPARVRKYLDFSGRKNLNDAFSLKFKPHAPRQAEENVGKTLSDLQRQMKAMQKELQQLQRQQSQQKKEQK